MSLVPYQYMKVKIKCSTEIKYETVGSSGIDIKSVEDAVLLPGQRKLIKTGIYLEMPPELEAQVRPRSGLALKKGITVLNTPGTIDSDYRGEIGVILINLSNIDVEIQPGERICQMVFSKYEKVEFEPFDTIRSSARAAVGFRHAAT